MGLSINYLGGGGEGGWEMVELCPKTKSYPPLIKQKSILTPPHIIIILRRMSKSHWKSHQNHWTLSLCRLRMKWEIPHLLQHLWH